MGGSVSRVFKNDKYYECHKLFITDHDEAFVDFMASRDKLDFRT